MATILLCPVFMSSDVLRALHPVYGTAQISNAKTKSTIHGCAVGKDAPEWSDSWGAGN